MRTKSLLMFIVAALFLLSCATVGPKSALQRNDLQTVVEETLVSGIQYYLEDIYDYDEVFPITQPVIKRTADSKILPDYFVILSRFNEDLFSTTETVARQTLVSGIQYYLEDMDMEDMDRVFYTNEPVIKQTADSKILPDYFAILSRFNEDLFPTTETVAKQTLVSGIQYYLEDMDMEDMDRVFYTNEPVIKLTADSKILPDYFVILSRFNEDLFPTTETVAKQTLVSGIQYYLEDIDNSFFITKTTGRR